MSRADDMEKLLFNEQTVVRYYWWKFEILPSIAGKFAMNANNAGGVALERSVSAFGPTLEPNPSIGVGKALEIEGIPGGGGPEEKWKQKIDIFSMHIYIYVKHALSRVINHKVEGIETKLTSLNRCTWTSAFHWASK